MSNSEISKKKGQYGEVVAAEYLIKKGYEILIKNYRFKQSEIDIISKSKNTIVFIEVKFRSNNKFGNPEDFVSDNQKKSIIKAAEQYLLNQNWEGQIRFDIIAIDGSYELTHFEDAFY